MNECTWVVHVMRWAGRTSQVIDLVDFKEQRVDDVVVEQFKVLMVDPVFYVSLSSREEVVRHNDLVTVEHQLVDQMRTDKTCAASDEDALTVLVVLCRGIETGEMNSASKKKEINLYRGAYKKLYFWITQGAAGKRARN